MNKLKWFNIKSATIALSLSCLTMTSFNAQAHDDFPLVPFILYNVLVHPQQHHNQQPELKKHYQQPRPYSRSKDGYSRGRLIKKYHRF